MADVQLENGYTKIANEILEAVARIKLSPMQYRLIFTIWRYTYGFKRKEHNMSLAFLSEATGCDKRQIQRELRDLEDRKMIYQIIVNGVSRTIGFNKNHEEWTESMPSNKCIGETTNGQSTNGEITIGQVTNPTLGETIKGTIGETTNQERNIKEKSKENSTPLTPQETIEDVFKRFPRYSNMQLTIIRQYWDTVRFTRKSGKVASTVVAKNMEYWERFNAEIVLEALGIHLRKYQDKQEEYTAGIMRRLVNERAKGGQANAIDRRDNEQQQDRALTPEEQRFFGITSNESM